jgi:DNA-binding CsgD family transcriptional regulator
MTYQHPTLWVDDRTRSHPRRKARRNADRNGETLPKRLPSVYPFPIDFLCDERLAMVLGRLVREAGVTEAQARVLAAILAGYTTERQIAHRLTISVYTVKRHLQDLRARHNLRGVSGRERDQKPALAALYWRYYLPLRPQILLLPRLDPALLELEPRHERSTEAAD